MFILQDKERNLAASDEWISCAEWALLAAIGVADLALAQITGVSLHKPEAVVIAVLALIFSLWPLLALLTRVTGFAEGSERIAENAVKLLFFMLIASCLEYYIAMMPLPLQDSRLIRFDAALGFDWPAFFDWSGRHPWIKKFLSFCYYSFGLQAALLLFAVSVVYPLRGSRFVTAFFIGGMVNLAVFGLVPAAGPFVTFHHTDLPQADYTAHYLQLRGHTMAQIPAEHLRGIVSFPSFHVASAVILTYFFRRLPVIFPVIVVVNIGMAIGALVIGGHYLADVIAGVGVGMVTLAIIKKIEGPGPERRLPVRHKKPAV